MKRTRSLDTSSSELFLTSIYSSKQSYMRFFIKFWYANVWGSEKQLNHTDTRFQAKMPDFGWVSCGWHETSVDSVDSDFLSDCESVDLWCYLGSTFPLVSFLYRVCSATGKQPHLRNKNCRTRRRWWQRPSIVKVVSCMEHLFYKNRAQWLRRQSSHFFWYYFSTRINCRSWNSYFSHYTYDRSLPYSGITTKPQFFSVSACDHISKQGLMFMEWFDGLMVISVLFYKLCRIAVQGSSS